jgi:hypothetical protein
MALTLSAGLKGRFSALSATSSMPQKKPRPRVPHVRVVGEGFAQQRTEEGAVLLHLGQKSVPVDDPLDGKRCSTGDGVS